MPDSDTPAERPLSVESAGAERGMNARSTLFQVPADPGSIVAGTLDVPEVRSTTSDRGRADGPRVRQVSRPVTALAGRTMLGLTSRCPLRGLHAFARKVGDLASVLPLRESRATRVNVALCFPALTEARRRRLERGSLQEAACMVAELGHLWLRPIEEILADVRAGQMIILLDERETQGNGKRPVVTFQQPIVTDRNGCEEMLQSLLWRNLLPRARGVSRCTSTFAVKTPLMHLCRASLPA